MNSASSRHDYEPYYPDYFGGVVAFTPAQFVSANGFSNAFFGWGGEDDDLRNRVLKNLGGTERNDDKVGR